MLKLLFLNDYLNLLMMLNNLYNFFYLLIFEIWINKKKIRFLRYEYIKVFVLCKRDFVQCLLLIILLQIFEMMHNHFRKIYTFFFIVDMILSWLFIKSFSVIFNTVYSFLFLNSKLISKIFPWFWKEDIFKIKIFF